MEFLKGIIYLSKALQDFNDQELETLINKSAAFNEQAGITGFLFYKKDQFIQYIEGQEVYVNALMSRIRDDTRHQVLCVRDQPGLSSRRYGDWNMRLIKDVISMELVLMDYLYALYGSIQSIQEINPEQDQNVWRMVEIITQQQQDLPSKQKKMGIWKSV